MLVVDAPVQGRPESHPLLWAGAPERPIAFDAAGAVSRLAFLSQVRAVAASLPEGRHVVNLCEDRYAFLVAFCAAAVRGQVNLLPPSRAPQVVAEMLADHDDAYALGDEALSAPPPRYHRLVLPAPSGDPVADVPALPDPQLVAIGFTSGSTGRPRGNPKTWGGFVASTLRNLAQLRSLPGVAGAAAGIQVVATVPPQHMYGMETTVLLPLLGDVAVHSGRPFFPAEIARALEQAPAPRVLVTTPVHLRVLIESGLRLPALAGIVSATAPLPPDLAAAAEARFGTTVLELFGSTETCVIAHRRTAQSTDWRLYDEVGLHPQPDGTLVDAPWLAVPVLLQDVVELLPERRFRLCGRNSDLLEIAGKRASLGDLTRRLLAVPGVRDGVVFQSDRIDAGGTRRIVALAVAPGMSEAQVLAALRSSVDPVFLPRPLRLVPALPRNEVGKLPREALERLLTGAAGPGGPADRTGPTGC